MSRLLTILWMLASLGLPAQEYQLAKPLVQIEGGSFFEKSSTIRCDFRLEGASIRYTLDKTEPTPESPLYVVPFKISQSATLKVKAFKMGFQPSETVSHQLFKLKASPVSVKLSPVPKAPYQARGGKTLYDQKEGSFNFRDGRWIGYNEGPVTIDIDLGETHDQGKLVVSTLISPGSWIMHPGKIEASFSEDGEHYGSFLASKVQVAKPGDSPDKKYYRFMIKSATRYARIIIKPLAQLPDWHPGNGQPGWVFLDEIFIQ